MGDPYDPAGEGAEMAFDGRMSYGDYLQLDAILGAPSSQEQLVLNTLFHLDASPGNIPWAMYRELADDPRIERAVIPAAGTLAVGAVRWALRPGQAAARALEPDPA